MGVSRSKYHKKANIYKSINILGKTNSKKKDAAKTKLTNIVDFYTKQHYLINNDLIPNNTDIELNLKYTVNDKMNNSSIAVLSKDEAITKENETTQNVIKYTYSLYVSDENDKNYELNYKLNIEKPKFNNVFLSADKIDLYFGSAIDSAEYITLCNRKYIHGNNTHTNLSYHHITYISPYEYSHDSYLFYRYGADTTCNGKEQQDKKLYAIDECLVKSEITNYNSNNELCYDCFYHIDANNERYNNLSDTFTVVKQIIKDPKTKCNRDEIIKYFKIAYLTNKNKKIGETEQFREKKLSYLIRRGIIAEIEGSYYYNSTNKHNYRDASMRYIDANATSYIGSLKIEKIDEISDLYDKNIYGYCNIYLTPTVNEINSYTLYLHSSSDNFEYTQHVKQCKINIHKLNSQFNVVSDNVYSEYIFNNRLKNIDINRNCEYQYSIDYDTPSYLNNLNNNFEISRVTKDDVNIVSLKKKKISYSYNGTYFFTLVNNPYIISTEIGSNVHKETAYNIKIEDVISDTNSVQYTFTYHAIPKQYPIITYNAYEQNSVNYNFTNVGYLSITDKSINKQIKNLPIYNLSNYDTVNNNPITLSYKNCLFNGNSTTSGELPVNVTSYNNIVITYNYSYNYSEITNDWFSNCSNDVIKCCCYINKPNEITDKYIIWTQNNNYVSYLTTNSYICLGTNSILSDMQRETRIKPIYYIHKGDTKVNVFNLEKKVKYKDTNSETTTQNGITIKHIYSEDSNTSIINHFYYLILDNKQINIVTYNVLKQALIGKEGTTYYTNISGAKNYTLTYKLNKAGEELNYYEFYGTVTYTKNITTNNTFTFSFRFLKPLSSKPTLLRNYNYIHLNKTIENYIIQNDDNKDASLYFLLNSDTTPFNLDYCVPSYKIYTNSTYVNCITNSNISEYCKFTYYISTDKHSLSNNRKIISIDSTIYKSAYFDVDKLLKTTDKNYNTYICDAYTSNKQVTWDNPTHSYTLTITGMLEYDDKNIIIDSNFVPLDNFILDTPKNIVTVRTNINDIECKLRNIITDKNNVFMANGSTKYLNGEDDPGKAMDILNDYNPNLNNYILDSLGFFD